MFRINICLFTSILSSQKLQNILKFFTTLSITLWHHFDTSQNNSTFFSCQRCQLNKSETRVKMCRELYWLFTGKLFCFWRIIPWMKKLSNKKLIFNEHGWFLKLSILLRRHSLRLSYAWQGNLWQGEITLVEIVEFIGKNVRSLSKRKTYSLIQEWISQPKEKDTSMQLAGVLSWGKCERFGKRLGQPTYHFAIYCWNTTASSLYSVCQWVEKQTKLIPESHLLTSTYLLTSTSRANN